MYRKEKMYIKVKEENGIRTCVLILFLDKSGSMSPREDDIYDAFTELMRKLIDQNETSLDVHLKIILVTFDNDVHVLNDTPLPPEQILELFARSDYKCGGGTSLARVFTKLDNIFSRKDNGLLANLKPGDHYPMVVYVSDYISTDEKKVYDDAKTALLSNRFYKKTRRLCLYIGNESHRSDAAELVGGEDNVVVLDPELVGTLLSPVLIGSTLLSTDMTHTNTNNETNTPAELAEQEKKRALEGSASAQAQKDQQLHDELKKLLGF